MRTIPPSAATAVYARALLDLDAALAEAITAAVSSVGLEPERTDAAADGAGPADPDLLRRLLIRLRSLLGGIHLLIRRPLEVLKVVSSRTIGHSEREWQRQLAALGVSLDDVDSPDVRKLRSAWMTHNVSLIKALAAEKVARVEHTIRAHRGARVETLAKRIQEATGTGEGHARLLARDQTLKLNAEVTRERHAAAGITEYVWRTSRDERVRSRHKELEGTRQKYDQPPVVDPVTGRRAHPGEDYQCRCTADPVLPGID